MAVKTLPAHPKPLAGNPSKWLEHAKERGQENLSIHALEQYSSASKDGVFAISTSSNTMEAKTRLDFLLKGLVFTKCQE